MTDVDPGDFYVEPDCCTLCGVPEAAAPEIFASNEQHCFVKRQPCTPGELTSVVRAMWAAEFDCIRYRGSDPVLLRRLANAGLADQADRVFRPDLPCVRDRVTFLVSARTKLPSSAAEIASAFRADMRRSGKRVLPAFPSARSVWLSWHRARFHQVRFDQTGSGRFEARLRSPVAPQGLSWLVDDWLRARSAADLSWDCVDLPGSVGPTPM